MGHTPEERGRKWNPPHFCSVLNPLRAWQGGGGSRAGVPGGCGARTGLRVCVGRAVVAPRSVWGGTRRMVPGFHQRVELGSAG